MKPAVRALRTGDKKTSESLAGDMQNLAVARQTKGGKEPTQIPITRQGYSTSGKEIEVMMNTFRVMEFPTRPIYQYEVNVAHAAEGIEQDRRVIRRCWMCDTRQRELPNAIFDGVATAWSFKKVDSVSEHIVYKGGKKNPQGSFGNVHGRTVVFTVTLRRQLDINVIKRWLERKIPFDDRVIEAVNFLDHLLRDWPATQFASHKRAIFFPDFDKDTEVQETSNFYTALHGGASVYRGIFQAIRPSAKGLLVNLDAAHGVFFSRISLMGIMCGMLDGKKSPGGYDASFLAKVSWFVQDRYGNGHPTEVFKTIEKKISRLRVMPNYAGCPKKFKGFNIRGLVEGTARQYMVDIKDAATAKVTRMTVEQYFQEKYKLKLEYPDLPLVQMENKAVVYPIEFLVVKGLQRWPFKLTEQQTAETIRYTAKRPADRKDHIAKCKQLLKHDEDPQLLEYGLKIDSSMLKTKARLLPSPQIEFGNAKHLPTAGKWDLRSKKFYKPNVQPLRSWGVGYFPGAHSRTQSAMVSTFIDKFVNIYKGHGGVFQTSTPTSMELKEDIAEAVKRLYEMTAKTWSQEPQLLIFIVPNKDAFAYLRIKKSCDCRYGVASQVLQASQVNMNNNQYHSNVLMKVNAKLGGVTSRVVPSLPAWGMRPSSIIIGADVTHPTLGVWTPSLAAMCISNDRHGISYMGGCASNGDNREIIRPENIAEILLPLFREWFNTIGQGTELPKYIYYLRDGVSESEYRLVLEREISVLRRVAADAFGVKEWPGKITAVIANKRHHLRAFPTSKASNCADRNQNPLPGTLIDRDVTSPHGWDFLLYAHVALQGTARPVHYKVILDEIGHKPDELVNLIYEQSYQYVRSTTSVSIHPAIYYAHLITARARHHENVPSSAGLQHGAKIKTERSKVPPAERQKIQFPGFDSRGKGSPQSGSRMAGSEQSSSTATPTGTKIRPKIVSLLDTDPNAPAQEEEEEEEEEGTVARPLVPPERVPKPQDTFQLLPMKGSANRLQYRMWWI
ncbi:hypothetical protein N7492_008439 [Penicillium capsulatum]|uniref:Piwi domain-containing protein n=1 Tax=Penicillium capsulatum TaxID=69766 RepID=A0A9W9LFX3_9EURO|nr:hypothetical protein N7492_008439 [Penicillium capsulatum]KAJ6105841.1 hypothetical protein N7512_009358 [Penicillium capsulatum]